MRAVGVTEYGGPEVLREIDVEPEPLGAGEVRIEVRAVAVSPTDTMVRDGSRADGPPPGPVVPGMDAAGVLREVGPDAATDLAVGDDVMAVVVPDGAGHGAYRSDLVVPAASVVRTPRGASYAEASTLPMNGLTARHALDRLALEPGQVLAVTGAAGAFGGYVVQLAKADGLVVVADASESDEALVRSSGPTTSCAGATGSPTRCGGCSPRASTAWPTARCRGQVVAAVKDGGAVATVRGWTGDGRRGLRFEPVMVRDVAQDRAALDRLREQVEDGTLTLRVADVVPPPGPRRPTPGSRPAECAGAWSST